MDIFVPGQLILNEKRRIEGFTDVMELSTYAGQELVCPNGFRGLFGKVSHLKGMLIGPGCIAQEELHEWEIRPGDIHQLQGSGQP